MSEAYNFQSIDQHRDERDRLERLEHIDSALRTLNLDPTQIDQEVELTEPLTRTEIHATQLALDDLNDGNIPTFITLPRRAEQSEEEHDALQAELVDLAKARAQERLSAAEELGRHPDDSDETVKPDNALERGFVGAPKLYRNQFYNDHGNAPRQPAPPDPSEATTRVNLRKPEQAPPVTPRQPRQPAPPSAERTAAEIQAEQVRIFDAMTSPHVKQMQAARSEYARIAAGRSSRSVAHGKEFSSSAVDRAYEAYQQALRANILQDTASAVSAGLSVEQLQRVAGMSAIVEASRLSQQMKYHELLATGEYEIVSNPDGSPKMESRGDRQPIRHVDGTITVEALADPVLGIPELKRKDRVRPEALPKHRRIAKMKYMVNPLRLQNVSRDFKEYWHSNSIGSDEKFLSRGTLNKSKTMLMIGSVLAIPLGAFTAPSAGLALGAVMGTRIAKFTATSRASNFSDHTKAAERWDRRSDHYENGLLQGLGFDALDVSDPTNMRIKQPALNEVADPIQANVKHDVRRNRVHVAVAAGTLALGSFAGEFVDRFATHVWNSDFHISPDSYPANGSGGINPHHHDPSIKSGRVPIIDNRYPGGKITGYHDVRR